MSLADLVIYSFACSAPLKNSLLNTVNSKLAKFFDYVYLRVVSKLHGVALTTASLHEEVVKSPLAGTKEPTNSDSDPLAPITVAKGLREPFQ